MTMITLSAGTEAATDITTLAGAEGVGAIDASAVTRLTGTVTDINAALVAMGTEPTSFTSTLSTGTEAATDITTLAGLANAGAVDAALVTGLTGTVAAINTALAAMGTEPLKNKFYENSQLYIVKEIYNFFQNKKNSLCSASEAIQTHQTIESI